MSSANLIACARCAVSKARCDRKVPCSQCVARNYVCQPRCSSRRPRAIRKPTGRNEGSTASVDVVGPMLPGHDPSGQEMRRDYSGNGMFDFSDMALPQEPFKMTGYEDFTMDETTSHMMFSSMPWMSLPGLDSQASSIGMGSTEFHKQHQELPPPGPNQLPTPALAATHTTHSSQTTTPGMNNAQEGKVEDDLRALAELLAQSGAWHEFPYNKCDATQNLDQDARDRIVAAVQLLLHRALCQNRVVLPPSTHGAFGRIVALPPSHVLLNFVELYATRIDTIHPYLGLAGSPHINIKDILHIDMADVGILLVILLITQGAMLASHHESFILAHGLVEICKLALDDVLQTRSIVQPMVGGCALQLLTLCAWSGKHSLASFTISKRSQYLSTVKSTGMLQRESTSDKDTSDSADLWENWKEQEQRNRYAYAWVYMDLELSLLHDLPPVLSINDLQLPLPQDNYLWHAQSPSAWLEQYSANGSRPGQEPQSLSNLFRSFLQGRLTNGEGVSFDHLRFLLHPIQAMVLDQQQLLRIFDTDEPSSRYRVLSKIKVLGRLQETQDLLQHLTTLLRGCATSGKQHNRESSTDSTNDVSMIMLHLVCLNVFTNVPEIEGLAKEQPPASDAARAEMWRRMRYPEGESYVLFHAGQVFRLVDSLPLDARPTWWPIAIYRASLACWSLRSSAKAFPDSQAFVVSIDNLLPNEEDRFLNTAAGTAVVTLPDGSRLPVLESNNSLRYCTAKLERHPGDLVRSVLEKVWSFSERWSS